MSISYLKRPDKPDLAYIYTPASEKGSHLPLVMFCGGYRSDMKGTKAVYLEEQCKARGQAYVRFDYAGHGDSEGQFEDGTIGSWCEDALAVFDHVAQGPVLVVGSSMGGWMALLIARAREGGVHGVIGIAAAPDFTQEMYGRLSDQQKYDFAQNGFVEVPNDYSDEPYYFTQGFYEEAKAHLLLEHDHKHDFPIRLVHGMRDVDVPWETAARIQKTYHESDLDILYIQDGDHRLSRPEDLDVIDREVRSLSGV